MRASLANERDRTAEIVLSWEQRVTTLQEEYDRVAAESETKSQELMKSHREFEELSAVLVQVVSG